MLSPLYLWVATTDVDRLPPAPMLPVELKCTHGKDSCKTVTLSEVLSLRPPPGIFGLRSRATGKQYRLFTISELDAYSRAG